MTIKQQATEKVKLINQLLRQAHNLGKQATALYKDCDQEFGMVNYQNVTQAFSLIIEAIDQLSEIVEND